MVFIVIWWGRVVKKGADNEYEGTALTLMVVGGVVTVLRLPVLPFVPEQSASHYLAHVCYATVA